MEKKTGFFFSWKCFASHQRSILRSDWMTKYSVRTEDSSWMRRKTTSRKNKGRKSSCLLGKKKEPLDTTMAWMIENRQIEIFFPLLSWLIIWPHIIISVRCCIIVLNFHYKNWIYLSLHFGPIFVFSVVWSGKSLLLWETLKHQGT